MLVFSVQALVGLAIYHDAYRCPLRIYAPEGTCQMDAGAALVGGQPGSVVTGFFNTAEQPCAVPHTSAPKEPAMAGLVLNLIIC